MDGINREDYVTRVLGPVMAPGLPMVTAEGEDRKLRLPQPSHVDLRQPSPSVTTLERYGLPESCTGSLGLQDLHHRIQRDFSSSSSSTTACSPRRISRDESSDSLQFMGDQQTNRRHMRISDSESEDGVLPTQDVLSEAAGLPPRWVDKPLDVRQFVDDISAGEKVAISSGVMSIGQNKQVVDIHAGKCQRFYDLVAKNAAAVGMKMNGLKTQLLCITSAINYDVRSFIYVDGQKITSGEELKLLGFYMGRRPRSDVHVREIRRSSIPFDPV